MPLKGVEKVRGRYQALIKEISGPRTVKVVNAIISEYGSPAEVHIEMARDLSRPLDERRDIEKLQKEFADRNEKDRGQL